MISVQFHGKAFNIAIIQVHVPNTKAREAEVDWFSEGLRDLLNLTPEQDVLFMRGLESESKSQELPELTGISVSLY